MIKHTFQVETWPMSCLKDSETQEGDFKGLKYEKFPGGACLRVLRSFRKSASIYPRSAPALYSLRLL